ncbi:helix-turn-helix domain-containing protein [Brucellaceae bacterium D45D]
MSRLDPTNLDIEKFRKVHALVSGGATDGERKAAKARAEAIAKASGMTFAQAVSKMDAPKLEPVNFFTGFDDWMEEREPGYKAKEAAARADRETARQKRCRELLKEFGSEDAVFAETEQELLLRVTLEPLADRSEYTNSTETYIRGYAGWTCRQPTPELMEALERAYPFPSDVLGVWAEYQEWQRLDSARCAFDPMYEEPIWVRAREAALEHLLDTMPTATFAGYRIRLLWLEHLNDREFSRDVHEDADLIARLRTDFETLATVAMQSEPADGQMMRRTNAEKRAAVLSMLDAEPELSDREISRRVGVSPQTVSNWRKRNAKVGHNHNGEKA